MRQRTLRVLKYINELDEPVGFNMRLKEDLGHFSSMYSAKIVVENMTDPNLTVVCEYNENNMKLAQPEHLIEAQQMTGENVWIGKSDKSDWINLKTRNLFRINRVSTNTKSNTITISAEPAVNAVRSGITRAYKSFNGTIISALNNNAPILNSQLNFLYGGDSIENIQVYTDNDLHDIGTTRGWIGVPWDMRTGLEILGGKENSLLDVSGGQFLKMDFRGSLADDTLNIAHQKKLGDENRNFILSARNQISGIDITLDSSKVYGSVCHYFEQEMKYSDTDKSYWQYIFYDKKGVAKVGEVPQLRKLGNNSWRAGAVYKNDWSDKGDLFGILDTDSNAQATTKIISKLPSLAKQWETANATRLNEPTLEISVDLSLLSAYQKNPLYAPLFKLQLGDSVLYNDDKGGYDIKAQLNGYTYDLMLDQYTKLTIGNGTNNILERLQRKGI